jgi:DUF4097 and DUF4098 domain-containing protein YvlB
MRIEIMKKAVLVTIVLLLAITGAWADREVEHTFEASQDVVVSIEMIAGSIEVIGWDRDSVQITGTLGDDVEELEIDIIENEIDIEVEFVDEENLRDAEAELTIRMPVGGGVEVEAISAGVDVQGIEGSVSIEVVSGGIDIDAAVTELSVESMSGSVRFRGQAPVDDVEIECVSGSIRVDADLGPSADVSIETLSGTIELRLPSDVSASFDLSTFSGDIDNDFGPRAKRDNEYVPGMSLEFSTGSGDASVTLASFSGKIELRRD